MEDLKDFIKSQIVGTSKRTEDIITFLQDNRWFGSRPTVNNGVVWLTDEQIKLYRPRLQQFIHSDKTIHELLLNEFPKTASHIMEYDLTSKLTSEQRFYIEDFLLYALDDELCDCSNLAVEHLLMKAQNDLIKDHGVVLTDFMAWLRLKKKTVYTKDFIMTERKEVDNDAYSEEEYLRIIYHMVNEKYIAENDMFRKATESRPYIDAWLYIALHTVCSLRLTDFQRFPYPLLKDSPEVVLEKIASGTFSSKEARLVLISVTKFLAIIELTPNKTKDYSDIDSLKFHIPSSCEVLFGTLFAIAEAHRQLAKDQGPFIRKVSDYKSIKRAMGDEIGDLFLNRDFSSRAATKSYLQSRFDLTGKILGTSENNISERIVSLARSHKGPYGSFSKTSLIYLRDAKFNGYTPEYIAFELLERGVLSFIPSMLLEIISNRKYGEKGVEAQTSLIKALSMSASEVEKTVMITEAAKEQAKAVVNEIVTNGTSVMDALHMIVAGVAFSKTPECMCLLTAIKKVCPYQRNQCLGCKYEISTKSTLLLLSSEAARVHDLYERATDPLEKAKYKTIAQDIIMPAMSEMLDTLKDYGEDVYRDYVEIVREIING